MDKNGHFYSNMVYSSTPLRLSRVVIYTYEMYIQERTGMDMNGHKGTDSAIGSTGLLLLIRLLLLRLAAASAVTSWLDEPVAVISLPR